MKDDTFMAVILTFVCIFLTFLCLNVKEVHSKEWKAGISVTVPLNFRDAGERGTVTFNFEAYDADRYSYSAIDNSITSVDNSTDRSRVDNRVTTTNTTTQSRTNITHTTNHTHTSSTTNNSNTNVSVVNGFGHTNVNVH